MLTFWILCPTLDMLTDMNMVIQLFRGPSPDLWVSGGKTIMSYEASNKIKICIISVIPFPDNLLHNGTISSLSLRIQQAYRTVINTCLTVTHSLYFDRQNLFIIWMKSYFQAYFFCGFLTFTPVAVSILFSLYLCHNSERKSQIITRVSTYFFALAGFYPQYLAARYMFLLEIKYNIFIISILLQDNDDRSWHTQGQLGRI